MFHYLGSSGVHPFIKVHEVHIFIQVHKVQIREHICPFFPTTNKQAKLAGKAPPTRDDVLWAGLRLHRQERPHPVSVVENTLSDFSLFALFCVCFWSSLRFLVL